MESGAHMDRNTHSFQQFTRIRVFFRSLFSRANKAKEMNGA